MKIKLLLFLLLIAAIPVMAAPKAPAATGYLPFPGLSWPVQKTTLANGLTVLTLEDHSAPVVAMQIWYRVGSRDEHLGITGVTHLIEHLMGSEEHSRAIQAKGGDYNAMTSKDFMMTMVTITPEELDTTMSLLAYDASHFDVTPEKFQSEKAVVSEERRMGLSSSPFGALGEQLNFAFYNYHSYRFPIVGIMADLDSLRFDDLKAYYKSFRGPSNAVLVLVGDFKTPEAMAMIKKYFESLPSEPRPRRQNVAELTQNEERIIQSSKATQLPIIMAAYHTPGELDADCPALEMLGTVLGGGKLSRLYQRIAYTERRAYNIGAYSNPDAQSGTFSFYAMTMPGVSPDSVLAEIDQELAKLQNELVPDADLARIKNQMESEMIFGVQSDESKCHLLGYNESAHDNYAIDFHDAEKYAVVTAADLQRVAKKYLVSTNRTIIMTSGQPNPTGGAE